MEEKIKILLDKIQVKEEYTPYFSDAKLSKIKINSRDKAWQVFIEKEKII